MYFSSNGFAWNIGFEFQLTFENNFKRTMNRPVTRDNMNEPSMQRTNWRYHYTVTYIR